MISLNKRSVRMMLVAVFISDKPGSSIEQAADSLNISYKTANRYLRKLRELGILVVKLQGDDSIHKYYPNPDNDEFFKLAHFLIEGLKKSESYFEMCRN